MDRTATQSKHTLLTLLSEIRIKIWKFSQLSSNCRSLEMTDCVMIQRLGVCNDSCEKDRSRQLYLWEIVPLPLCPLLLVNHQTRSETLPIDPPPPRRTIHYCREGWFKPLLDVLTFAQWSLVNRIRMTITLNEHHTVDEAAQLAFSEGWVALVKERLRQYYEQVEVISWTFTAEENLLPEDICTVPEWQMLRMELGVEKAREKRLD